MSYVMPCRKRNAVLVYSLLATGRRKVRWISIQHYRELLKTTRQGSRYPQTTGDRRIDGEARTQRAYRDTRIFTGRRPEPAERDHDDAWPWRTAKSSGSKKCRKIDGISAVFAAPVASLLAPSRLLSELAVSEVSNAGAGTASKHSAGREPAIRSQVKPSLDEIVKNRIATGQLSRNELLGHMRRRVQR